LAIDDFASNHNGGLMIFGPGGLYIGTGDGGGSGDPERTALNTYSLLGKILRISPYQKGNEPYTIPAGNPFIDGGGAKEVYSYGLRNPWRFSIADNRIWIGDVGQSELEEISAPTLAEAKGASFGWSALEGTRPFNQDQKSPNSIKPVLEYKHKDNRCSVTGGYVVQDKALPQLLNRYIYSDYCQGIIRSFKLVDDKAADDKTTSLSVPGLASFAEGSDGQIWVISKTGPVYQLVSRMT
jgi:glucose/arabinose dehydrogenase